MPNIALIALLSSALLAAAGDPPQAPAKPAPPAPKASDIVMHCKPQTGLPREKLKLLGEEWDCELCLDDASRRTGMGARCRPRITASLVAGTPRAISASSWA